MIKKVLVSFFVYSLVSPKLVLADCPQSSGQGSYNPIPIVNSLRMAVGTNFQLTESLNLYSVYPADLFGESTLMTKFLGTLEINDVVHVVKEIADSAFEVQIVSSQLNRRFGVVVPFHGTCPPSG